MAAYFFNSLCFLILGTSLEMGIVILNSMVGFCVESIFHVFDVKSQGTSVRDYTWNGALQVSV
ncbi:hypothetical protein ACQP3C_30040, partial [Escherichia coli]